MSERSGDKARFERERQKKMRRRERTQAARKAIGVKTEAPSKPTEALPATKTTGSSDRKEREGNKHG